ncbi:MAG: hypothetical protein ABI380_02590 [Edaphobacter sp.]
MKRTGAATLFPCGECSRGYAMALGGEDKPGSLRVNNIKLSVSGDYTLRIQYTRNGLQNKQIGIEVNGAKTQALAIMRSWDFVDVPITLRTGDNELTISHGGKLSFYVDKLTLLPRTK